MAKRQNDPAPAEDYIDQLEWRARHGRSASVRFEPRWKYKIVYRYPPVTFLDRAIRVSILIGIILLITYLVGSDALIEEVGARVFFGIVFGLIFIILFFAVKDASRANDEDDKAD
jgi:hypothetical protein